MSVIDRATDGVFGSRKRTFLSDEFGLEKVIFDATTSISKSSGSTVSSHAIEKGSDVTDHIYNQPESFNLDVVISDADKSITDPLSFLAKSVSERLLKLEIWKEDAEVLWFYSYDEIIESVIIESITENISGETGKGRSLYISLKKVNIVSALVSETGVPKVGATPPVAKPVPANNSILKSASGVFK